MSSNNVAPEISNHERGQRIAWVERLREEAFYYRGSRVYVNGWASPCASLVRAGESGDAGAYLAEVSWEVVERVMRGAERFFPEHLATPVRIMRVLTSRADLEALRGELAELLVFLAVERFALEVYGQAARRVCLEAGADRFGGELTVQNAAGATLLPDFSLPFWQSAFDDDLTPDEIVAYLLDDYRRKEEPDENRFLLERVQKHLAEEADPNVYDYFRLPRLEERRVWDLASPPQLYSATVYLEELKG